MIIYYIKLSKIKLLLAILFIGVSLAFTSCHDVTSNDNLKLKACETIDDCGDGLDCISGFCKEELIYDCLDNNDCPLDYICSNTGSCVYEQSDTDCSLNEDCSEEEKCNKLTGLCELDYGCTDDNYCINNDVTRPACSISNGTCYECLRNQHCNEGYFCDSNENKCISEDLVTCITDSNCGMNEKCNNGLCVSMFAPECEENSDCTDTIKKICIESSDTKRCVECSKDSECEVNHACNINVHICEYVPVICDDDNPCLDSSKICYGDIRDEFTYCVIPSNEGYSCEDSYPCKSGLICNFSFNVYIDICVVPALEGDTCENSYPCEEGLNCSYDLDISGYLCKRLGDVGDTCRWSSDCKDGLHCDSSADTCKGY